MKNKSIDHLLLQLIIVNLILAFLIDRVVQTAEPAFLSPLHLHPLCTLYKKAPPFPLQQPPHPPKFSLLKSPTSLFPLQLIECFLLCGYCRKQWENMGCVVIEVYCEPNLVFEYGKKKVRSMFWRVRAEVKKQLVKKKQRQLRFSFHYDPFSYALNFDNGDFGFLC